MIKHSCIFLLLVLFPGMLLALPPGWTGVDEEIVIKTVPLQMAYDRKRIQVKPGARIKLTLVNEDELAHNLILCKMGDQTWLTVAQAAWALGEKGMDLEYIPDSDLVLHATKMVNVEESQVSYFIAPKEEGIYPYVCTFPGHAFNMRGELMVGDASDASGSAGISQVTYKYYEGSWQKLPDFTKLTPVKEGHIEENLFDLSPHKRGDQFGMVFDAELSVPSAGVYSFRLESDDGSRILIDGKTIVDHDGLHSLGNPVTGRATLTRGKHRIQVQYFEQSVDEDLRISWAGPGVSSRSLTPGKSGGGVQKHQLFVTGRPKIARMRLPDSSPRSIAVGLPVGISYCFDTSDCSVRYAWFGGFLDAGPDRGNGTGRGGGVGKLLGDRFNVGYTPAPLKISGVEPVFRFEGYQRESDRATMMYKLNDLPVLHSVAAIPGQLGIQHHFRLDQAPPAPLTFAVKTDEVNATSDAGTFVEGLLTIPPAKARSFTVTILQK